MANRPVGTDNPPPPAAPSTLHAVAAKVAPPLIWMGIGWLAATWFYKPKRAA